MTYDIVVRAIIDRKMQVEADSEDEAIEIAHSNFDCTTHGNGVDEKYREETVSCKEVDVNDLGN